MIASEHLATRGQDGRGNTQSEMTPLLGQRSGTNYGGRDCSSPHARSRPPHLHRYLQELQAIINKQRYQQATRAISPSLLYLVLGTVCALVVVSESIISEYLT